MKLMTKWFIGLLVVSLFIWTFVFNWSFIFKKRVVGEVSTVEKITTGVVVMNTADGLPSQAFSFSIAIKDLTTGEIHMASSEDRKWAAAQPGNCVVAAFFPYPPWMLSKGTSDYNARLVQNFQSCETVEKQTTFWGSIKFFFLWI